MQKWNSGYTVIAICATVCIALLLASVTLTIIVGGTDPDVFLRFLSGGAFASVMGVLTTSVVIIANRKVNRLADKVDQVQENTNGNTSALLRQIQVLTNHVATNAGITPAEAKANEQVAQPYIPGKDTQ